MSMQIVSTVAALWPRRGPGCCGAHRRPPFPAPGSPEMGRGSSGNGNSPSPATTSHVEPVERLFVLDALQAIEQRGHLVASEMLRQQQEFLLQLGAGERPLRRALEARHLTGYLAAVLEPDRDGRDQVAAVLSGRHRHLGAR